VSAVSREVGRLRAVSLGRFSQTFGADRLELTADSTPIEFDILSPLARQLFTQMPGAGALQDGAGVLRGEAGSTGADTWVRFHLRITDGTVRDARFQAYGCPHTLAVAAWLTRQLPGRALFGLSLGDPAEWARALDVPTEKLGRLLVVEDALHACLMSAR
jgi:hypothetical protein